MFAVFLGFIFVRLQVVDPKRGETKGFGFFIGQISYPMLVFKTCATAKFGSVDIGTVGACTLAKILVMLATWLAAFGTYGADRPRAKRILTASLFAFYVVTSNDFALGFPVINSVFNTADMGLYVAANALVTQVLFMPVVVVLLAIGTSMLNGIQQGEGGGRQGLLGKALGVVRDIILNPAIAMTLGGMLYACVLGSTLVEEGDGSLRLPSPLYEIVNFLAQPFGVGSLFLTGTSLRSPAVSFWPLFLVAMKVAVCAYTTFWLAGWMMGSSQGAVMQGVLQNFSFLYGMIPASSTSLIFADQFEPGSSETIATAVLYGMVVAGPMMFIAALFLDNVSQDMTDVLVSVQFTTIVVSLACGAVFLLILAVLGRKWGYANPSKALIAVYGALLVVYELLALALSLGADSGVCDAFGQNPWYPPALLFSWFLHACQVALLLLQAATSLRWCKAPLSKRCLALLVVVGLVLSTAGGVLAIPTMLLETCSITEPVTSAKWNSAWIMFVLLANLGFACYDAYRARRSRRDAGAEAELEKDSGGVEGEQDAGDWKSGCPMSVVRALVGLQAVKLVMELVSTWHELTGGHVSGSFAEMLVLRGLMEHGQLVFLVVAMLSNQAFCKHFVRVWKGLWKPVVGIPSHFSQSFPTEP
jgi:hypothetical protein